MAVDLIIEGGEVATVEGISRQSIAVDGGRIVAVGESGAMPRAEQVIDVAGKVILPGAIDAHTHFCEDLGILAEPYETGTQAAAAGGVTTVLLMPWDTPPIDSLEHFEYRRKYAEGRCYVDYTFHGTVLGSAASDAWRNLPELASAGITAVKVLMVTDDPHFPHLDDGDLVGVLRIMKDLDLPLIVHAENHEMIVANRDRLVAEGRIDPLAHEEFRSSLSENEAVRRLTYFAEQVGARVVVAHMSTAEGVLHTRDARDRGSEIYAEICPRNLWLSTVDLAERGPWVKTGPPVRDPAEVEALWPLLRDGSISIISSDHAAWTKENKQAGEENIWMADGGIPSVQEMLPLALDAVSRGRISLADVVRLSSYNPSRIFGLRPRKGLLEPGYDADLVVVDMERTETLTSDLIKAYVGYSAFEGREIKGWPVMTFVRGQLVMENNQIVGAPAGRLVRRTPHNNKNGESQ
ncbi:MAG: dihydroorotase family protein [Nocardioides sp.]|uniref:dihydroorotase n=1 Tax=Nocardioides sp. TaxID=35761 RepID=UPI0039E6CA2C